MGTESNDTDALFTRLYDDLRTLAMRRLAGEPDGHLLHPADLLHDVYLRLAASTRATWPDPAAFRAAAARTIRRVLIDHARRRNALKRGGGGRRVMVEVDELLAPPRRLDLLAIDRAIAAVARTHPDEARLIEIRFYGGLGEREAAGALAWSIHEVRRRWAAARRVLRRCLDDDAGE